MVIILAEFDRLIRLVQRHSNLAEPIPPLFIRMIANLETSLSATMAKEKEAKKKMNATNARALNAMKQKIKKTIKEYEKETQKYQAVSALLSHGHFPMCFRTQMLTNASSPLTVNQ